MSETSDPNPVSRFGRLELIARLVVEGVMAGLHRSPFKGASVEFAEHRQYGPGDEIRHIDWRAYGKTDRYFVKEFEESTSLTAFLVLDTSASMAYAGNSAPWSKLEHARRLAASLAHLMIGQRDSVGLTTSRAVDDPRSVIPPRSTPGHIPILCRALEAEDPAAEIPLSDLLHNVAACAGRRALVVILSDGFEPIERLALALRHLRHRHHEVLFLQILDPDEETFPFTAPALFRGLEAPGRRVQPIGTPETVRARYLARFEAARQSLRESLLGMNFDYVKASTSESVESILLNYLSGRAGRHTARSGRNTNGGG